MRTKAATSSSALFRYLIMISYTLPEYTKRVKFLSATFIWLIPTIERKNNAKRKVKTCSKANPIGIPITKLS